MSGLKPGGTKFGGTTRTRVTALVMALALIGGALAIRLSQQRGPEWLWYDDGIAASQKGDLPTAIEDFQRAIEINPRFARAYELLSDAYLADGRPTPALNALDRMRLTWPHYPHVYTRIAECHSALDNDDLTRWSLAAVLQEPRSSRAYALLALARARSGDLAGAREELSVAGNLGGENCQTAIRNSLGAGSNSLEFTKRLRSSLATFPY